MEALLHKEKDESVSKAYEPKWDALSGYAKWLAEVEEGLETTVRNLDVDCSKFLIQNDAANITQ
jgi:hypothetical protein